MLRRLLCPMPLLLMALSAPAWAQEDDGEEEEGPNLEAAPDAQRPPQITSRSGTAQEVQIDFVDTPITDIIKYFARITGRNFILTDDLKGEVTIISHKPVSVAEAYEAFLSALEVNGYTTVVVGGLTKVVPNGEAANQNTRIYENGNIPYTDNFVTQIIQLENISVSEISTVIKGLVGKSANVIAYAPTNTLILTDSAINIRRVYRIINQLDVAAPKAQLEIIPLQHATASEVEQIIEELYGSESSSTSTPADSSARRSTTAASRRNRRATEAPAADTSSTTSVGAEGKYIQKIIADERTNSLIIMANEEALTAVRNLISDLDVDVDPSSRAQIHVIYLEHAKAEDVAQVLSNLSNSSSSSSSRNTPAGAARTRAQPNTPAGRGTAAAPDADSASGSAVAAFDSGMRITSDENTNSLVIIATPDQFRIIDSVIGKLDIVRKQVFVEAVIMELASEDSASTGLGIHLGTASSTDAGDIVSIMSGQLGSSSLGLTQDLLTGSALGVIGPTISVPFNSGTGVTNIDVPAFGVVLQALQSNSTTNILSTPNILTMDNEEAKIVVGRNIPFPVSNSFNNNGQPVISYQREDVAITLQVTPQINESNYVTLEVFQEVQEVEEDSQGLDVSSAGFITSKRSTETTVVVRDNQTIVIGGLMGSTDTEVQTKVPVLGDLPLLGRLFRGTRTVTRKTNLLIFLTPHVIDEPADLEEVYRIKVAQRQEFIRRFYGKSRAEQEEAIAELLRYSMNRVDLPSEYRGPDLTQTTSTFEVIGSSAPANDAAQDVQDAVQTISGTVQDSGSTADPQP